MRLPQNFFFEYFWLGLGVFYLFFEHNPAAGFGCFILAKLNHRDY